MPNAQVHLLDAGHFALDTAADEIAELVRGFVASPRAPSAGSAAERRPRTIKIARSPRTLESRPELRSDVESTINGTGEVQFGISTVRIGNLFPVCRRGPLWPLGRLWPAERVVGRLRPIRGLYGQAKLVFAGGNDPDVSDDRHGC